MFRRTTVLFALAVALAAPASAPARQPVAKPPVGLKAFLLRYDEAAAHTFSRTPSFGWKPVARAASYDFQLSTSSTFRENSIVWSTTSLAAPYTAVPVALPWTTGHPYSLFARVRAHKATRTTRWSSSFGFNIRWTDVPTQLSAPNGVLRWTPIDGATSYEVLELGQATQYHAAWKKAVYVATNVSDMRDWFTFHQTADWVSTAYWRVRAVRVTYGTRTNGSSTVSYGPWSPTFTTTATPQSSTSALTLDDTISDVTGTVSKPVAHAIMPGFSWSGTISGGAQYQLYRAYVFSDSDCVEPVMVGSIVGSPSWVPRLNGPLVLPASLDKITSGVSILTDGTQGSSIYDYTRQKVVTSETSSDPSAATTTNTGLDLWDRDWPSGVYYWTVVPVKWGTNTISGSEVFEYQDVQSPQDACAAGRVARFGRTSQPAPTGKNKAYVTSLSPTGKMMSKEARKSPSVFGTTPLLSWTPALGADSYEVQVSQSRVPFTIVSSVTTLTTSTGLSLSVGTWYYRVRGINTGLPSGAQGMAWSSVRKIKIVRPSFRILR